MLDNYLLIGEVLRPQGIRGELKVRPLTNNPARFFDLPFVFVKTESGYEKRALSVSRADADAVYLTLAGCADRNAAEALRRTELYIDRAHAAKLGEDENFICDLIGCRVTDDQGLLLGTLTDVLQPGGNDVYVIRDGRKELLVPALKRVVVRVDVAQKEMVLSAACLSEVAVRNED